MDLREMTLTGGSCWRDNHLGFSRPLPALGSAPCPDMNPHPLVLPLSCVSPTVRPQPRLTHPFAGTRLPASSRLLKSTFSPLPLLFLLSLPPLPFYLSFPLKFPSSHLLWPPILPHDLTPPALPLSAERSARGRQMSPFMVKLAPRRWMRNLHSQVSASSLLTVCLLTPTLVTFG